MIQTPMVGLVAVGLWMMVGPVGGGDHGRPGGGLARADRDLRLPGLLHRARRHWRHRPWPHDPRPRADGGRWQAQRDAVRRRRPVARHDVDRSAGRRRGVAAEPDRLVAAFASSVFIAAALLLSQRAGWLNMAVLVAFGWELQVAHAAPHGPIAFALLIVAAGWLAWTGRRRPVLNQRRGPAGSADVGCLTAPARHPPCASRCRCC